MSRFPLPKLRKQILGYDETRICLTLGAVLVFLMANNRAMVVFGEMAPKIDGTKDSTDEWLKSYIKNLIETHGFEARSRGISATTLLCDRDLTL